MSEPIMGASRKYGFVEKLARRGQSATQASVYILADSSEKATKDCTWGFRMVFLQSTPPGTANVARCRECLAKFIQCHWAKLGHCAQNRIGSVSNGTDGVEFRFAHEIPHTV